jgi:hypothetical protein
MMSENNTIATESFHNLFNFIQELNDKYNITSNEYLQLSTELQNIFTIINKYNEDDNENEDNDIMDEGNDYVDIDDEINRSSFEDTLHTNWTNTVIEYQYNNNINNFSQSKFNLCNEINLNTIYDCGCTDKEFNNCGALLNCCNIQHLLLKFPLLIIVILSDKYDEQVLIDEYNKYFKFNICYELNTNNNNDELNTNDNDMLNINPIIILDILIKSVEQNIFIFIEFVNYIILTNNPEIITHKLIIHIKRLLNEILNSPNSLLTLEKINISCDTIKNYKKIYTNLIETNNITT